MIYSDIAVDRTSRVLTPVCASASARQSHCTAVTGMVSNLSTFEKNLDMLCEAVALTAQVYLLLILLCSLCMSAGVVMVLLSETTLWQVEIECSMLLFMPLDHMTSCVL